MKPTQGMEKECSQVQGLLSEYIDGTLFAADTWQVEKHIAACSGCAEAARQMRVTVDLLQNVPQHELSDDFMSRLHAQLDTVEPARASVWVRMGQQWDHMRDGMQVRRAPMLGLGVASLAAVLLVAVNFSHPKVVPAVDQTQTVEPLQRSVALAAENPFDDPLAANLEAHNAMKSDMAPAADTGE